jgi:hypothetical protein
LVVGVGVVSVGVVVGVVGGGVGVVGVGVGAVVVGVIVVVDCVCIFEIPEVHIHVSVVHQEPVSVLYWN